MLDLALIYNYINVKIPKEARTDYKLVITMLGTHNKVNISYVTDLCGVHMLSAKHVVDSLVRGGYGTLTDDGSIFAWTDKKALNDAAHKTYCEMIKEF